MVYRVLFDWWSIFSQNQIEAVIRQCLWHYRGIASKVAERIHILRIYYKAPVGAAEL